jgi:FKBP-type peptidyl-prolyl cis-trans isomerase
MLLLALTSCGPHGVPDDGDPALPVSGEPATLRFAPVLHVNLAAMTRTASGLYYRDVTVGRGPQADGHTAVVHYTGWLANGKRFDTSRGGQPFTFRVGAGEVIPGWDEGVAGMRVGGRRILVVPPGLGYGAQGADDVIPPHATLVFDVELIDVR